MATMPPRHQQSGHGWLFNWEGWLVAAGWVRPGCRAVSHLQGADAALHTHCRHPAPLGGPAELGGPARPRIRPDPRGAGGMAEHTRAVCTHTPAHALHRLDNTLAPFHPSLALHRR